MIGFKRRKARVYVPKGVILSNWSKSLVSSPAVWWYIKRISGRTVPNLEREVQALGRYHHAHVPMEQEEATGT